MTDYVALQPIVTPGGALAHNPGDPVPAANVEQQGYVVGEQVAEQGSAEADGALRALGMLPATDAETDAADDSSEAEEAGVDVTEGAYDPAGHTVDEVNAWLAENPGYAERVMAAEVRGKHRAGIVHGPHGSPPDVAEG